MVQENLVTNIVAKSDFSDLISDLNRVSSRLTNLSSQLNATNKTLAVQAAQIQKSFATTLRSTGQFSTHFVSLTSDVDKFGKGLDAGKLKLSQYFDTYQKHIKTSGGLIRQLATQQVQLQNAILQPLGKNAEGLMQYNVQIPTGLDKVKHSAAIARQELQIMNKVMQQGANQLINWGKNTQWAGRQLTVGLTLPLTAFGKAAADAFRQADQELVRLTKVYGGIAATSAADLKKIRQDVAATARELSQTYGASYKDTISLAADIAATGKEGNDLLKSTQETTRLSILGEVDRQEAMKATLAIQSAFKQNTTELADTINFLNAVENQTSTSLNDLIEAIPKAGPVVQSLGGSVQDLALYLTAMREGGINASEGANALKSALASLINPTNRAKDMFLGFGIDLEGIVTKNAGNLTGTILELQKALDTLNPLQKQQAIEQLFGKFQFSRLNALFANLGKQGSQTLQVLDLMKASTQDLANIAGRELGQITESASGQYKRALETLKADLADTGESFLKIGTKVINVVDKIIVFFNKLPDPIKNILGFVGGLTALAGPIIMLTGLLANFFGYIVKGVFHFKSLFKGGEGWKLLTPEILAAEKAGNLLESQFYQDARASAVLQQAIKNLTTELNLLEAKANGAAISVGPAISTVAGNVIVPGAGRVANPQHPLIGPMGSRASMHMNPVGDMTEAQRLAQTIFGMVPGPTPLNQKVGKNPQIYMNDDMPSIPGLTTIGGASTGIIAAEAAKWHSMTGAIAMQSEAEIKTLKAEVAATGLVTTELADSYQMLLPEMTKITTLAAQESAMIVKELQAGKLTMDQARAKIVQLNFEIERMMAQTTQEMALLSGRTAAITTVPFTNQPVVDPVTGRSNMKEMFHKSKVADLANKVARSLGVRTSGGGYAIETTIPKRFSGGKWVPGSGNEDTVPAMLTPGEFVVRKDIAQSDPQGMMALNDGQAVIVPIQKRQLGGPIFTMLQNLSSYRNRVSGARTLKPRSSSSEPARSDRIITESGSNFARASRTGGGGSRGRLWSDLKEQGIIDDNEYQTILSQINKQGWGTVHGVSSEFQTRFGGPGVGTSYPEITGRQLRSFTEINTGRTRVRDENLYRMLPSSYVTIPLTGGHKGQLQGYHMSGLAEYLLTTGLSPKLVRKILNKAASNFNRHNFTNTTNEIDLFNALAAAENQALMHFQRQINNSGHNSGGKILGYGVGGWPGLSQQAIARLTARWGKVRGVDSTNQDPLHGPLSIGTHLTPMTVRSTAYPSRIQYGPSWNPFRQMQTINVGAIAVGSAEERARYAAEQYAKGAYGIMQDPTHRAALLAARTKGTGTFFRGIHLQGNGLAPLPKWLMDEIKTAKATGDFSRLVGKEFIMRRSSWSSDPQIARGFGDFYLMADVKNRNMTPISDLAPDLKFNTPQGMVPVNEQESYFGGKFRIVQADGTGLRLESVSGPMSGNRAFGGNVFAGGSYVVGENGPEMFVPNKSGTIIPGVQKYGDGGGPGYTRGSYTRGKDFTDWQVRGTSPNFKGYPRLPIPIFTQLSQPIVEQAKFASQQMSVGLNMMAKGIKDAPIKLGVQAQLAGESITKSIMGMGTAISNAGKAISTSFARNVSVVRSIGRGLSISEMRTPAENWSQLLKTQRSFLPASGTILGKLTGAGSGVGGVAAGMAGQMMMFSGMGSGNKGMMAGGAALMFAPQLLSGATKLLTTMKASGSVVFGLARLLKSLTIPGALLTGAFMLGKYIYNSAKAQQALNEAQQAAGGAKSDNVKKVSVAYESLGDKIEKARKEQELYAAASANALGSAQIKGVAGLTLSYKQLKSEIESVKKNAPELVSEFQNAKTPGDVIKIATNYKAAFVASGMSIQEATNSIYALISAAGRGKDAVKVLADQGFVSIQDKASAAKASVDALNSAVKGGDGQTIAQSVMAASEIILQSGTNIESLNLKFLKTKQIGYDVKNAIALQNEELAKVVRTTDTYATVLNKAKILASGIKVNILSLSDSEVSKLASYVNTVVSKTNSFISNDSTFKKLRDSVKSIENAQLGYSSAVDKSNQKIQDQADKLQENYDKEKQRIQDKIDLINEEADARLKALDATKSQADFESELAQATLEYQNAIATGNVQAAAAAKSRIDQANKDRQYELARTSIEESRDAQIKQFEPQLKDLEAKYKAQAKELKSVQSKLKTQQTAAPTASKIDTSQVEPTIQIMSQVLSQYMLGGSDLKTSVAMIADAISKLPESLRKQLDLPKYFMPEGSKSTRKAKTLEEQIAGWLQKGTTFTTANIDAKGPVTIVTSGKGTKSSLPQYSGQILGGGTLVKKDESLWEFGTIPGIKKKFMGPDGKEYEIVGAGPTGDTLRIKKVAMGGYISGPGTSLSDSIPAMLSNGEYVINAQAVQNVGVPMLDQINRMATGGLATKYNIPGSSMSTPRYASGGLVSSGAFGNSAVFNFTFEAKIHPDDRRALINDTITAYKQQTKFEQVRMGRSLTYSSGGGR